MKKVVIIMIGGFAVALIIIILLTQKTKTPVYPAKGVINNAPTTDASPQTQLKLKTYTSPSGFSFQYPKSLLLTEKKITDQSIYAWVELTDPQKRGVVSVKLESSNLAKIDDWAGAAKMKKVKLADLEGRELTSKNQTTTLALDQGGVLITITTDSLLEAYQQIISSFIFTQPDQTTTNISGDGEGDVFYEGEEVIE